MLLQIALGLGEDDHVSVVANAFEIRQGNGVGHATIEQLIALKVDDARHQRHRGRGANPVVGGVAGLLQVLIDSLARFHIGTDGIELHGVGVEGLVVENIQLARHRVIGKLGVEIIACGQERTNAAIARIVGIGLVVADGTAHLPTLIITSEGCSCRHANESVGPHIVSHHHVDDA